MMADTGSAAVTVYGGSTDWLGSLRRCLLESRSLSRLGIGLRDSQFSTVSASRPVTMVSRKNRPVMCPLGEG